jgi:hypothetical protein
MLRWALVASVVLVLMLISTSQVALASVPGDLLYPLKTQIEQLEINYATSVEARTVVSLTHAKRRAHEIDVLLSRGQFDALLLRLAYDQLTQADNYLTDPADFDGQLAAELIAKSETLRSDLATLLDEASQPGSPLSATLAPQLTALAIIEQDNESPAATATAMASETATPSATTSPTATASPTPTLTLSPTPAISPTATLEANIVLVGPIEAIDGSTVTVYGIAFQFDPDNALLSLLVVGDIVRIDGQIVDTNTANVSAAGIHTEPGDDTLAISEDGGTVWRDDGNCDNPPPSWAPANGWRRRCENGGNPGGGNQGGNNSNRNNSNRNNSNRSSNSRRS